MRNYRVARLFLSHSPGAHSSSYQFTEAPGRLRISSVCNGWRSVVVWVDLSEQYRQAASYIDKVLKGASPGELPIQAPNKFELIINQRTAKDLRIAIPM